MYLCERNGGFLLNNLTSTDLERMLLSTLKKYWGYDAFRKNQLEICQALMQDKRDCFFMMSTGSGKSLVFQLPAIAFRDHGRKCCTIIISPLLSLIEDQVSSLLAMGVNACAIGSQCDKKIEEAAMSGYYSLIYATPEKILLWQHGLEILQRNCEILSIAIDESHCVSEWGNDFRPEYSLLKCLREWIGFSVPVIALTASATLMVQDEIVRNLELRYPLIIRDSVNRPNLKYFVRSKTIRTEIIRTLIEFNRELSVSSSSSSLSSNLFTSSQRLHLEQQQIPSSSSFAPTLIYVNSKKLTEEIAKELVSCSLLRGIKAAYYHSGLSAKERASVHRGFLCDDISVVVATTAFGMGINKPDIRLIIHYGMPLSIESYYQQTGRAGRDGFPSKCVLFWNSQDFTFCSNLINNSNNSVRYAMMNGYSRDINLSLDQSSSTASASSSSSSSSSGNGTIPPAVTRLMKMNSFVKQSNGCRRESILQYFQENFHANLDDMNYHCCDLCDKQLKSILQLSSCSSSSVPSEEPEEALFNEKEKYVLSEDVYMLLSVIFDTKSFYGITVPISILLGKHDKNTSRIPSYESIAYFGKGIHHSSDWWKELTNQLVEIDRLLEKYLVRSTSVVGGGGGYNFIKYKLTCSALSYLTCQQIFNNETSMLFSLKKKPFSLEFHSYSPSLFLESFQKIMKAEQQVQSFTNERKKSAVSSYEACRPSYIEIMIDPRNKTSTSYISKNYYSKEKKEIERILKEIRKTLANQLQVTPYQVLTSLEIFQLLETDKNSFPTSIDSLISLLKWPDWKRSHAQLLIEKLIDMNLISPVIESATKDLPCSLSSGLSHEAKNNVGSVYYPDVSSASFHVASTSSSSSVSTAVEMIGGKSNKILYRPSYVIKDKNVSVFHVDSHENIAAGQEESDDYDSDATCEQKSPAPVTSVDMDEGKEEDESNGSSNREDGTVITLFDEGHLADTSVSLEGENSDEKENELNRSYSVTSSTAAMKAQRKRHLLAGFSG
jgi:RecQ family ATP-dependent DNA helicase